MSEINPLNPYRFKNDQNGIDQWWRNNPYGFYLNKRSGQMEDYMLHHTDCKHLKDKNKHNETATEKICHQSADVLVNWAQQQRLVIKLCKLCLPSFPQTVLQQANDDRLIK